MDVGVGRTIMKKATRRLQIQETNKNRIMKASTISFPAASNNIEAAAEIDCMDSLFNLVDSNNKDRSNLEIMLANLKNNPYKRTFDEASAHIRAIVELLQLEVNVDISNITLQLEDTKMLQDQLGWKEKMLNDELEVVKNDIAQYERYISNRCYDFKNDTWKYLINLGTAELQNRQVKLEQMKSELKNQYQVLHQRMRLCHLLLWTLNNEQMKRQQRLHTLSFVTQVETDLCNIVIDEVARLQNTKSVFDLTMRCGVSSVNHTEKTQSSILKEQKLGCTFDFVLHHRVNYCGGSSSEYDNIVNIFDKKFPAFGSVKNSCKTKKLLEDVFKKQTSRLERENEVYSLFKYPADSGSQVVSVDLSSSCFNKLPADKPHVPNPSERDHTTLPSCLTQEQDVQNQTQTDPTNKRQENERYLSNSEQNDIKITSCTKTEESKKQRENEHKKSVISHSDSEQDRAMETKQQEQSKTKITVNVKKKKKNNHNRYGLRTDLGLHLDSETEGIVLDVKPASESDVEQHIDTKTTKRNKDQDGSDNLHGNKNSIQKNKNEIRKLSEGYKPAKLITNSSYENKIKLMKKLSARMDSLEKLVQETNLELSNIKEGTEAFQRSMEEFKSFFRCHKDCRFGLEATACKSVCESEEEKISELLESLKTMYTFLKRSKTYESIIEERESSLLYMKRSLRIDEMEELVLRAASDIQELPLPELKKMQTKDLKLKDISKILTSVQNLMQYEEEGCFSDSTDSSIQIL